MRNSLRIEYLISFEKLRLCLAVLLFSDRELPSCYKWIRPHLGLVFYFWNQYKFTWINTDRSIFSDIYLLLIIIMLILQNLVYQITSIDTAYFIIIKQCIEFIVFEISIAIPWNRVEALMKIIRVFWIATLAYIFRVRFVSKLEHITLLSICDAPGGAVVEREPEFGMTSEILWVTSSQIPVHVQLLHPQVHHRYSKGLYSWVWHINVSQFYHYSSINNLLI